MNWGTFGAKAAESGGRMERNRPFRMVYELPDRRGDTGDSAKPRVGVPSHHLDRLNEAVPDWRRGLFPRRESEYLKSIFDY